MARGRIHNLEFESRLAAGLRQRMPDVVQHAVGEERREIAAGADGFGRRQPSYATDTINDAVFIARQVGHHDVRVQDARLITLPVDLPAVDEHGEVTHVTDVKRQCVVIEAEVGLARRETEVDDFFAGGKSPVVIHVGDAIDLQ